MKLLILRGKKKNQTNQQLKTKQTNKKKKEYLLHMAANHFSWCTNKFGALVADPEVQKGS